MWLTGRRGAGWGLVVVVGGVVGVGVGVGVGSTLTRQGLKRRLAQGVACWLPCPLSSFPMSAVGLMGCEVVLARSATAAHVCCAASRLPSQTAWSPWPRPAAGTSWATLFACVQAALVAAAHGKLALAAGAMAAPLVCGASLLHGVAMAQGHGAPLQALALAAAAYRREARLWRHLAARLQKRRWALHPRLIGAHQASSDMQPSDHL